jgi:hypothetical protein
MPVSKDFPDIVSQEGHEQGTANASNPKEKIGGQLWRIDFLFVHR